MGTINERLKAVADYYGLNRYSEFAEKTGLPHQTVSNYLKGKQKPDVDKLSIIQRSFDEVDALWLLTGQGEMLRAKEIMTQDQNKSEVAAHLERENKFLKDQIKIKDNEINRLWALLHGDNKKAG